MSYMVNHHVNKGAGSQHPKNGEIKQEITQKKNTYLFFSSNV